MACHIIATTVLLYLELHENVLGRILFWCKDRKLCCYKKSQNLILTQKQIQSIRLLPELDEYRGRGGAVDTQQLNSDKDNAENDARKYPSVLVQDCEQLTGRNLIRKQPELIKSVPESEI